MNPFLFGIILGVVLALLNFLASRFYSLRIITRSRMTSIVLALVGFIGRLTMIGIIFYGLTKVKWIHFQTFLITFVIFFTLCTIWKAAQLYRDAKPLSQQHIER